MTLDAVEWWVGWASAVAMLITLVVSLLGLWRGLRRPKGRAVGRGRRALGAPLFYLAVAVGYFGFCVLIWQPLPLALSPLGRIVALSLGALLYFSGLALVLWGRLTLGRQYFVSTSFGATLHADHRLITEGPFAFVRHPMYVGLLFAGLGGLLIYRTWTFVFIATSFLSLIARARREEQALAEEFGEQWDAYCRRVPAWIPRLRRWWKGNDHMRNSAAGAVIRSYAESDEAAVAALWREVFPDAPSWNHPETDIRRKLAVQRELFLVATQGSEIVGTAMAGYDGHRGWVYYVVVSPRHRRQGIGTALMRSVEQGLARLGCPKLNLQVRASNHEVVAFYKQLGYKVEERISMGKRLRPIRPAQGEEGIS